MASCSEALASLPVGFEDLPVERAVEILAVNHALDAEAYFECKTKQEAEARWIGKQ